MPVNTQREVTQQEAESRLSRADIRIRADEAKAISPDLFGIFFEDLNYAPDGGLYAELIQNRSFAYSPADNPDWNFFTSWELHQNGGKSSIALDSATPLHPNNPHYLVLNLDEGDVELSNGGFDGIVLKAGEAYDVSLFARVLSGTIGALQVRLMSRLGEVSGEATLDVPTDAWVKYTATRTPRRTNTLPASCRASKARVRWRCAIKRFFASISLADCHRSALTSGGIGTII